MFLITSALKDDTNSLTCKVDFALVMETMMVTALLLWVVREVVSAVVRVADITTWVIVAERVVIDE